MRRFARLQERMPTVEAARRAGRERCSIIVVPSRTLDRWHEPPAETQAYEERLLSSLLELRDPNLQLTYVTAAPVAPSIVDYYLSLLPARLRLRARRRLTLIALGDRSPRPLSEKLLERSCVLERIRRSIPDPRRSYLLPYNATAHERDIAVALNIPIYGPDPQHARLGTKSGSRELFALAGIPYPLGVEHIESFSDGVRALARMRAIKPAA